MSAKYDWYNPPQCCKESKEHRIVFMVLPDSFWEGDTTTPPTWNASGFRESKYEKKFFAQDNIEVKFCPFCGKPLAQIVPVPNLDNTKYMKVSDGGDYCDNCNERTRSCKCKPPTKRWMSKS
jgi:hypothetical protein